MTRRKSRRRRRRHTCLMPSGSPAAPRGSARGEVAAAQRGRGESEETRAERMCFSLPAYEGVAGDTRGSAGFGPDLIQPRLCQMHIWARQGSSPRRGLVSSRRGDWAAIPADTRVAKRSLRGRLVPCIRLNQASGMQAGCVRLLGPGIGPGSEHAVSSPQPGSGETAESAVFSEPGCAGAAV
jgi:hypothetical protein